MLLLCILTLYTLFPPIFSLLPQILIKNILPFLEFKMSKSIGRARFEISFDRELAELLFFHHHLALILYFPKM
jgi:hypothetical protein